MIWEQYIVYLYEIIWRSKQEARKSFCKFTIYTPLWSSYFVSKISSKCNKNSESSRYGNNVLYIFIKFFYVATKRWGKVLQVPNLRIFMAEIFCPSHVGYSAANMWKHSIPTSFMKNKTCRWEQVHPFILTLRQGCSML